MTLDQVQIILDFITAAYPRKDILPVETVTLYARHLEPLPFEWAADRVKLLVMSSKWPPTIAELLTACGVNDDDDRRALMLAIRVKGQLERSEAYGWALNAPNQPQLQAPGVQPIVTPSGEEWRGPVSAITGTLAERMAAKGWRPGPRPWEKPAEPTEPAEGETA